MKARESWGSKLGFLMATAGSAVGLGSLWKFPYATGENGGGLFVLAYLVFTFLIGVPIFIAELVIGRSAQKSPVLAFSELIKHQNNWRLLGWSCVLATFFILSYYTVVAGWALNYAFMSLLQFSKGKTPEEISQVFDALYSAGGINLFWNFLFLGLTAAIVYRGIRKGIEFWSKILMPALFAILLLLFFYGITLEGFPRAVSFILKPNFSEISASGLLQALGLSCFTLSIGMGIILTYGSYMRKYDDIPKTSFTIALMSIFVSLLAALMIFPIIFTFHFPPSAGPGLLFKSLPVLFAKLPGSLILSTTFFVLVVFAALTSTISVMEVLVATVTEVFQWSRPKGCLIVAVLVFILGIPSALSGSNTIFKNWTVIYGKTFFDTIDYFSFTWLLPLNSLFIAYYGGWAVEKAILKNGFLEGTTWGKLFRPWLFLIRWVVPIGILLIMLQEGKILDFDKLFKR